MGRARSILLLGGLALAAWFAWMAVYQVDDAYIVYRYAANLARGRGFVFNSGERVEGVTCFLWTVALAPFAALGLRLPVVAPILTGLCGCAACLLVPFVSARLGGRRSPDLLDAGAGPLLAAHPGFAYWSVGGLETVPYALLLLLALGDQAAEQRRGSGRRSAIWMGLASLVRPEGPALAAALALGRLVDGPGRSARSRLREALFWCGLVAAFVVPLFLFRRVYFGDWVPNTYYAKTSTGWLDGLHDGRVYTLGFLSSLAPGFGYHDLVTAGLGVGLLIGLLAFALPRPPLRSAALLILALGAIIVFEGGDWMALYRFWVPALPAVVLLVAASARALIAVEPRARPYALALGVVLVASSLWAAHVARDAPDGLRVNEAGYRFAHDAVAAELRSRASAGDAVALMDIGRIGYETDLEVIDISGLTDRDVARSPGGFLHKTYPVARLLSRRPRFFVLVEGFPIDDAILRDPAFAADYAPVLEKNHRFNWTPPDDYTLRVYELRSR